MSSMPSAGSIANGWHAITGGRRTARRGTVQRVGLIARAGAALQYAMPDEIVAPRPRSDTSRESGRIHMDALRRLGIAGRASMTFELSDDVRRVAEAGVRHRHPEYDDDTVRLALVWLWLGPELFRQVHPAVEIDP